jgi:hypothetical protein
MTLTPPITPTATVDWHDFMPLSAAVLLGRGKAADQSKTMRKEGVYAWGFPTDQGFVLWYVGKATKSTSIQTRLRDHFMSLIGGRYKIPKCFGEPEGLGLPTLASAAEVWWELDHDDPKTNYLLHHFASLEPILKAGFRFAEQVVVWIGAVSGDAKLDDVEAKLIHTLRPLVNTRHKNSSPKIDVTHGAGGQWVTDWLMLREAQAAAIAPLELAYKKDKV